MPQTHRFWNWIARRYSRMPVSDEASYQEKLTRTQALFEPDWKVLEIGCGTGSTAIVHAPHVAEYIALDSSPKMIEICRDKAKAAGADGLRFELASAEGIDAAPESFDAVLALSILHLLDDRDAMIQEIFRILRPGGIFVSSTICLEGQASFFLKGVLPVGNALGVLPPIYAFSRDSLLSAVTTAGFEIEQSWQPDEDAKKAIFLVARKPADRSPAT